MIPQPLNLQHLAQARALNASMWQLDQMAPPPKPAPTPLEIVTANLAAGHRLCYHGHDGLNTYWYFVAANKSESPIFKVPSDDHAAWAICQPVYAEWRKNS